MKFKFCGGADVPEWVLAEVSVLSKISCVRLKLICRQVITELAGGCIDFPKVMKLIPKDSGFTRSDIRGSIAAIAFILSSSVRASVDAQVLNTELQQLGLPKENSDGISRPYRIHRDKLIAQAHVDSLRHNRLLSVAWRADELVASSSVGALKQHAGAPASVPMVHLRIGLGGGASDTQRYTAANTSETPLLRGEARSVAGTKAPEALDATFLALGFRPLVEPPVAATTSSDPAAPTAAGVEPAATASALSFGPLIPPKPVDVLDLSLSHEQLLALITELRIAQNVLQAVQEAT